MLLAFGWQWWTRTYPIIGSFILVVALVVGLAWSLEELGFAAYDQISYSSCLNILHHWRPCYG